MKTVYVLGAGVDRALGLPLADGLLRELDAFAKGDGKAISQTIKGKLGGGRRVRFSFEKYVSNQGENFAERVLTDPTLAGVVESALEKVKEGASDGAAAVQVVLEKLRAIREANELDEETANAVAALAGESEEMADHTMLRMRGVALNPAPRNAMLRIFRNAQSTEGLSEDEREALGLVVAAMTNFEELLTELFAGFYSNKGSEARNYLYVSWLLWAYMRWKSLTGRAQVEGTPNFYAKLANLTADDSVITFNYTALCDLPQDRTVRFHGDCLSFIRQDRGELITNVEAALGATDLEGIEKFIGGLDMSVEQNRIYLPAVVPPSAMKPVINRAFITRWAQAEQLMTDAGMLIVVGYAFNRIDSHFNDLFRVAANGKRVAVVNPSIEDTREAVCRLLGVAADTLTAVTMAGVPVQRSNNLLFVPLRGEDISDEMFAQMRDGWA
ncbi:MAG: hypothetical protein H3C62_06640 [Gemmatimonadaceae bacterium]|nr:hypothetical protein [Gemmatimonadaceae bacterium]